MGNNLFLADFENVRPMVRSRLVNYDRNNEMLMQEPHIKLLDMAVVFGLWDSSLECMFHIKNSWLETWGIGVGELSTAALENEKTSFRIIPMADILLEILERTGMEDMETEELKECEASQKQYVITRDSRQYGAAVMARKDIFREFALEHNCNKIIIFPSSIHELIIMEGYDNYDYDIPGFKKMVSEINDTQVRANEILSYSVYVYDADTEQIVQA